MRSQAYIGSSIVVSIEASNRNSYSAVDDLTAYSVHPREKRASATVDNLIGVFLRLTFAVLPALPPDGFIVVWIAGQHGLCRTLRDRAAMLFYNALTGCV